MIGLGGLGCASSRIHDCTFYFDRGELDKAESCCDRFLERAPNNADALFLKGRLEGIQGDYEAMNRHFNASLDHSSKHRNRILYHRRLCWSQRFDAGARLFNEGKFAEAIPCFHDAVKILPDRADSRIEWCLSRLHAGQEEREAREYLETLSVDSLSSAHWNNLTSYYLQRREYERAVDATAQVLRRDSTDVTALTRRAPALVLIGRFEEALETYARLVSLVQPSSPLLRDYARVAYELGRYSQALDLYQQSFEHLGTEKAPDEAYAYLGLCAYEVAEYGLMAQCFEDLAELRPEDASVWRNLVVAYIRLEDDANLKRARARLEDLERR